MLCHPDAAWADASLTLASVGAQGNIAARDSPAMATQEDGVEKQRKRLLYQSRHRGIKESDLFLGAFANRYLPDFGAAELAEYETILAEDDDILFDWIYGRAAPPHDGAVIRLMLAFRYRP
ncbi:MAG: succinate dehydrogenase assembly factor 2 [Stellaceae bacterium]